MDLCISWKTHHLVLFLSIKFPVPLLLCLSLSEDGEEEALTKKEKDERRIAEMGRPTLGEHVKVEVIIEESYEFKVPFLVLKNAFRHPSMFRHSHTFTLSLNDDILSMNEGLEALKGEWEDDRASGHER